MPESRAALISQPRVGGWGWAIFLLGWLGGVIGYFALKSDDERRANHVMKWGLIWTVPGALLWVISVAGIGAIVASGTDSSSERFDDPLTETARQAPPPTPPTPTSALFTFGNLRNGCWVGTPVPQPPEVVTEVDCSQPHVGEMYDVVQLFDPDAPPTAEEVLEQCSDEGDPASVRLESGSLAPPVPPSTPLAFAYVQFEESGGSFYFGCFAHSDGTPFSGALVFE